MASNSVPIKSSERVSILGATGSGKTVLARHLIQGLRRIVVIDPKHTFKPPARDFMPGSRLPLFRRDFRIIYRPRPDDDIPMASLLYEIWNRGNTVIYVDELATISDMYPATTQELANISRTGRERGVGVWASMQRPRFVPRVFLTESEIWFVFRLRSLDDRRYVAGFTGEETLDQLPPFSFWSVRPDEAQARPLKLDLDTSRFIPVIPVMPERN